MVKYVSIEFNQFCQKFQHERNFSLPENDKNEFYERKNLENRLVWAIRVDNILKN